MILKGPVGADSVSTAPGGRVVLGPAVVRHIQAGCLVAVIVLAAGIALWPTAVSLFDTWRTVSDYNHGALVAAVWVIWMGIVCRQVWTERPRPAPVGAAMLGVLLMLWLLAWNANSLMIHQLLFPAILLTAIVAVAGFGIARRFALPVAFLYFAIPLWDHLVPLLQWLSVTAAEGILHLVGVPAQISEYRVSIPAGTFEIIEGCSGKRYFMVTLALAVLAGAFSRLPALRFAAFVAIAGGIALLANWIRIAIVIYAGHATSMQHYFVAVEHRTLGNVIFGLILALVLLIEYRLSRSPRAAADPALQGNPHPRLYWQPAVPALLLLATFGLCLAKMHSVAAVAQLGILPVTAGPWQGPMPPQRVWRPAYTGTDAEIRAAYLSAGGAVELYVNAYGEQHQGRELVNFGNSLLAPGSWTRPWPLESHALRSKAPATLDSFEAHADDGSRWVIAYTYEVGGWQTRSALAAQLAYGLQSVLHPTPAGVLALAARCDQNCDSARAAVTRFWEDMSAPILALVPDERRVG
jgi:EpsI family protein